MAGKEIAGKKYVVKLTIEERERLDALIRAGESSAQLLTRARILLRADVSEGGEGWSDSAISAALDTSINNVSRTRQQLVEEGFEAKAVQCWRMGRSESEPQHVLIELKRLIRTGISESANV